MTQTSPQPDPLMTEKDAAELLCLSPRTLRNWRVSGYGPAYVKISGRCVRYRLDDLVRFVDERTQTSTSAG